MSPSQVTIREVLTGTAKPYGMPAKTGKQSAIDKHPVGAPVAVDTLGLHGDEQGDRRIHGGPEKAVHCYPWQHYADWRHDIGPLPVLERAGAFGENLSWAGGDEHDVCLGDVWRIGSVTLQVSQPRQPCWKLNVRFGRDDMSVLVQQSLRIGWYFRVLEPGRLQAGDAAVLLERPHADWSVARLAGLVRDRETDPALLDVVLALPLVDSWRRLFERRRQSGAVEDWTARMRG